MADSQLQDLPAASSIGDTDLLYVKSGSINLKSAFSLVKSTLKTYFDGIYIAPVIAKTSSYTLVLSDANSFITMSNASALTLTVPPNSSVAFPVGTEIALAQTGAGVLTVVAGSGVTIQCAASLVLNGQYATAALKKIATDTWILAGRLV